MRQRGKDSWELRVYQGVDATSGRQRWATRTVHGSVQEVRRQLKAFAEEVERARTRTGSMGDLLEQWFEAASPHWAVTTARQTRSVINRHLLPHLGHLPVVELTTAQIDALYGHLRRSGGRDGRPLTPGTVHRIHVVLHRALAQALRWEWIWINPASTASPPRFEPTEIHPPTPGQVMALLAFVRDSDPDLFTYLRLAVSTGARRSQLLALRRANIDLARAGIAFTRGLVEGPNGPELRPTKTGRTYRVAIDAETVAVITTHRDRGARRAGRDEFLFSADGGQSPWKPNHATKRFIAARRAAGLPHFRLHDLRHFMATQMLTAGISIAVVSQRLSHSRASTTLNVYAHAIPGGDEAAAETLATILAGAAREPHA